MLRFEHVSFAHKNREILSDISFEIAPGEVCGVLGASGAGKSTVLKLLMGELRPTVGSVWMDSFRLEELSRRNLQKFRRQIGFVPQDLRLLPQKTVFENIAFALEVCGEDADIPTTIPPLLELVGIRAQAQSLPHELSGGEAQRLAIARALVHSPKILIADEATGNLDPENARGIGDLFRQLNEEYGLTVIFSTHDSNLIQRLKPRVLRIEKGRLSFDRPHCTMREAFGEGLST